MVFIAVSVVITEVLNFGLEEYITAAKYSLKSVADT